MVLSMTGFGKSTCTIGTKKISIEIKSLNSKQLDLTSRVPSVYREKDLELRNLVSSRLERGKVEFGVFMENIGAESSLQLNGPVIQTYCKQIKNISQEYVIENGRLKFNLTKAFTTLIGKQYAGARSEIVFYHLGNVDELDVYAK